MLLAVVVKEWLGEVVRESHHASAIAAGGQSKLGLDCDVASETHRIRITLHYAGQRHIRALLFTTHATRHLSLHSPSVFLSAAFRRPAFFDLQKVL